jgi:hypothetical protein
LDFNGTPKDAERCQLSGSHGQIARVFLNLFPRSANVFFLGVRLSHAKPQGESPIQFGVRQEYPAGGI